jgi:16S rRNA (guanine527-N7)-methyltransferase
MAFDSPSPQLWQALGWEPAPEQLEQLLGLQLQLREWNARLNLTRLVEGEDFWVAQVLDSLWPCEPCSRQTPRGLRGRCKGRGHCR